VSNVRITGAYGADRHWDGQRILVDRIWPRGPGKERWHFAEWAWKVAPRFTLHPTLSGVPWAASAFSRSGVKFAGIDLRHDRFADGQWSFTRLVWTSGGA